MSTKYYDFYVLKSAYLYIQSCDVLSGENETINFTMTDSEGKPISKSIFVEIFDLKGHEIDFDYINLIGGKYITMAKSKLVKATQQIAEAVTDGYKKIETGVVDGYKKIEQGVVGGYTKIEDKFIDAYLTKDDETVEEAKARLKNNNK